MPKAKIILTQITPEVLRQYEGRIVARESGLVVLKKVYVGQRMDYHFIDNPKEMLYGHLSAGFYAVVAWSMNDKEQLHYHVMQSQLQRAIEFVPKQHGKLVVSSPEKYWTPLVNIFLNEHEEASLVRL